MTGDANSRLTAALGHKFQRPNLLEEALTHSSAAGAGIPSYERLEFLGDRVLGLALAGLLIREFPHENEGDLALRHAALVSRDRCAVVAREISLGDFIRLAPGEMRAGSAERQSILADSCEAVIGAVFLDGGFDAAGPMVERLWAPSIDRTAPPRDPKTALQEWAQGHRLGLPVYRTVSADGPAHDPLFTIEVAVSGFSPCRATGRSKRMAEQAAAALILTQIENDGE